MEDPEVWRQILVPSQFTFHQFHQIIQVAFGRDDSHLYEFYFKSRVGATISLLFDGGAQEITDSNEVILSEIFIKPR